jgi:hypothetical protein
MDNQHQVDARYQYRFAYGDIVCYPLSEKERRGKFATKNELGFYLGDKKGMKGGTRSLPEETYTAFDCPNSN